MDKPLTNSDPAEPVDPQGGEADQDQSLLSHLVELRERILKALAAVLVSFLCLAPFANQIYEALAAPLLNQLPSGSSMIATEVASPFIAPFKLTLVVSLMLALPFVLWQAWSFIAPGLYRHEKKIAVPLLISSSALFYLGAAFAYFAVFPLIFAFFTATAPEGVAVMTDIGRYLDFVLKLFLAFGVAFEVPVATILMLWVGLTTRKQLAAARPYVVVGCFIVGMLLTPPDIVSQVLLAIPVWLLFEFGLILAGLLGLDRDDETEEEDATAS